MTGDRITFTVLSYGKPVPAAPVVFETGSGWRKTARSDRSGRVTVQLIRDYFPETWRNFDDRKKGSVLLTATCDIAQPGVFAGTPYSRVHMITTVPWKYQPARQEYTSYAWGLGIAALFAVFAGAGTFMYREHRSRPYREGGLDAED